MSAPDFAHREPVTVTIRGEVDSVYLSWCWVVVVDIGDQTITVPADSPAVTITRAGETSSEDAS
jgi:hypothetical protein